MNSRGGSWAMVGLAGIAAYGVHEYFQVEKPMKPLAILAEASELAQLITLPGDPLSVAYHVTVTGGDSSICAVLEYGADAAASLLAAAPLTRPTGGMLLIPTPEWALPMVGNVLTKTADGVQSVSVPLFEVTPFARSPYLQGYAYSPAPGRIVVCMFTT